jgi:glycosyltransferase involved in cell wall biosynthesis
MVGQRGVPATYGGVERHVEEIGARLVGMGHEVIVYCRPHYTSDARSTHRGIQLRHLNTLQTKHFEAIVHSAGATLSAIHDQVDIVHYHALGPGLVSPLPRVGSRAKVVQTIHGLDQDRSKWGRLASSVLGLGCWMSARVPDATVVVSRSLQQHYRAAYGRHTSYICNGVDAVDMDIPPGETLQRHGLTRGDYLLFVGRLVPEKAPDLLLRAFRRLARPDLRLVIAGGSSFTAEYVWSLRTLARRDTRVVMTGYLHGEPLEELYANAAAFVLPSDVEGMPLTLLEAAAHGTPILASDIDPHREMLGVSAPGRRLFRRGDEDDLVATLEAMLADPVPEVAGAHETRLMVHKEFSWDRAADELAKLYSDLVRGRRSA